MRRLAALAVALALAAPAVARAQSLTVTGLDGTAKTLTAAQVADLPRDRVAVKLADHTVTYEGPRLAAVLRLAGAPVGVRLHGDPLKAYLVIRGADGFFAVASLAEVDPDFHEGAAILADHVDGQPLPAKEAPWRLVIAGDRKVWRSVYAVSAVEVRRAQ